MREMSRLFHHVLTSSSSSSSCFNGLFYEHMDRVTVGSLLTSCKRGGGTQQGSLQGHVDSVIVGDMFVIWPPGPKELKNFLNHLNKHSS
jgi:hypothetical protein